MPISFLPLLYPLFLLLLPLLFMWKGRKAALAALLVSCFLFVLPIAVEYVPGMALRRNARAGDPKAQYEYARWKENHSERIGRFIPWGSPDVLGGYEWLERSAEQEYPPAVFAIGARLKHGIHVPRPENWNGPGGNVFAQPVRGQRLIDRALGLGFQPRTNDEYFYWFEYRSDFSQSDYSRLPHDFVPQAKRSRLSRDFVPPDNK